MIDSIRVEHEKISTEKLNYSTALNNLQRASLSLSVDEKAENTKSIDKSIAPENDELSNPELEIAHSSMSIESTKVLRENSNSPSNSSFSIAGTIIKHN